MWKEGGVSQRVSDEKIAAIRAETENAPKITASKDFEFRGVWLTYDHSKGGVDEFYLSPDHLRVVAAWLHVPALLADLEEAREHRRVLREALLKFGRHAWGCGISYRDEDLGPEDEHCSCGLQQALAATENKP